MRRIESDYSPADSDEILSSRERHKRKQEQLAKRKIRVELDNQSFFFLVHHNVCPNDDNSEYDQIANRIYLIN